MNRRSPLTRPLPLVLVCVLVAPAAFGQRRPRARDLGVPFDGTPGALNAITDVKGVEVGFVTLVSGGGELAPGRGPVRTGVTAILPQGKNFRGRLFAAWHTLNGNGEMTGTTWVEESGGLGTPVLITNTHSVGVVRDAVIEWNARRGRGLLGRLQPAGRRRDDERHRRQHRPRHPARAPPRRAEEVQPAR